MHTAIVKVTEKEKEKKGRNKEEGHLVRNENTTTTNWLPDTLLNGSTIIFNTFLKISVKVSHTVVKYRKSSFSQIKEQKNDFSFFVSPNIQ